MLDDRLDLTPLDPDDRREAAERFVAAVMDGVAAIPTHRPQPRLGRLVGPMAIAATALFALAGAASVAMVVMSRSQGPETVAEALGVPVEFRAALAGRP